MAEFSGFFDAHYVDGKYDRAYLAEHFAKYFSSFIGNGVFGGNSGELIVRQKETAGMSVRVLEGRAFINGYFYENDSELSMPIDIADGTLNRIDLVVLRFNNAERVIRLAVKRGASATNAVAPTLQRDADFYELALAEVYVRAGATSIIQANITDKRLNKSVCGLVQGVVQQFDTTDFGTQIDSFISNFEAYNTSKMNEVLARLNAMANDNDLASLIVDIENLEEFSQEVKNKLATLYQSLGYKKSNLIAYPYHETTKASEGVTWLDNEDGSITVNGLATSNSWFTILSKDDTVKPLILLPGSYVLSGGSPNCFLQVYSVLNGNTAGKLLAESKGPDGVAFTIDAETKVLIQITVPTGSSLANVVVTPNLRKTDSLDVKTINGKIDSIAIEDDIEKGCFYRIDPTSGMKTWLNPPNKPGWEYCTTEMWDNKPVYQMTFYVASLPVNSAMSIETNTEWDKVVSVSGYAQDSDDLTYYPFPIILHSQITPLAVISRVESDGFLVITTNGDASYFKAYITVKYTKN